MVAQDALSFDPVHYRETDPDGGRLVARTFTLRTPNLPPPVVALDEGRLVEMPPTLLRHWD